MAVDILARIATENKEFNTLKMLHHIHNLLFITRPICRYCLESRPNDAPSNGLMYIIAYSSLFANEVISQFLEFKSSKWPLQNVRRAIAAPCTRSEERVAFFALLINFSLMAHSLMCYNYWTWLFSHVCTRAANLLLALQWSVDFSYRYCKSTQINRYCRALVEFLSREPSQDPKVWCRVRLI